MNYSTGIVSKRVIRQWVESVGGFQSATILITKELGCSDSKAEKIAAGSYPSRLTLSEQKSLSSLTNKPIDALFLLQRKRAS